MLSEKSLERVWNNDRDAAYDDWRALYGVSDAPVDYVLSDWQQANLRFPSAFKPVLVTLNPALVALSIGQLSNRDLAEVDARLRLLLGL